jgi:hypothetical protein
MDFVNFNIRKWLALCPEVANRASWGCLAEKQQACQGVYNDAPVNLIPAMMRRRMSSLSKLALQSAIQLSSDTEIDYIVFASRHGELTRTVALLQDIIAGGDASPIMFSQSVHNTAAGLFTIASKRAVPVCSLAGGENTLHNALLEASCYLQENPQHTVLLINFDEPLPAPYQKFDCQESHGFAFGLLLQSGDDFKVKSVQHTQDNENQTPQAFSCIDYLLHEKPTTLITSRKNAWLWEKTR